MLAGAQSYPRLHIEALAQRADRAEVDASGTFELTIHVKIAQRRERLDELILGSFANCEIISNETIRSARADGTDFIERLTIQALAPGEATITPAYIDAFDPALGKPMRFSSNGIRVHVRGAPPLAAVVDALAQRARRLVLAATIGSGIVAFLFVLGVLFVRRKRRPAIARTSPPAVVAPVSNGTLTTPAERLLRASELYRAERSAVAIERVRATLFELAGVIPGSTLVDALRALGDVDRDLRRALLAAEAAAFGPALERDASGDAMLAAVQAYCDRGAANGSAWKR